MIFFLLSDADVSLPVNEDQVVEKKEGDILEEEGEIEGETAVAEAKGTDKLSDEGIEDDENSEFAVEKK